MNKKIRELLNQIDEAKQEARNLAESGDTAGAKMKISDIQNLNEQLEIERALAEDVSKAAQTKEPVAKQEKNVAIKAFKRALAGKPLTEEMQNALILSDETSGGMLAPEVVETGIRELRRGYPQLKNIVDVIPVSSGKGSIVIENQASIQNLVNFDEETDLEEQTPSFNKVAFAVKNKGAVTPISNVLLEDETAGLPTYIMSNFVKKAIRTENADILAELKRGKTAKALTTIATLKKSFNKDLDPALNGEGAAVITNQDGFDHLDQEVDGNGRPLLQVNPADATQKKLFGLPVIVLSNNELPTASGKAPIFYGNFVEGVKFFDRKGYEVSTSTEAGFTKHQTLMKIIERYDVKQGDASAYAYGELTLTV